MKTLKHSSKGTIAVITETTVYLAMLDGTIIKHFPSNHFNDANYGEEVEFPTDFETARKEYNVHQANKRQEQEAAHQAHMIAVREERKQALINLWNWRKGKIGAYRIRTVNQPVELFGRNPNIQGSWENVFFGKYEEAKLEFDSMIGSWTPEFDNSINNVQGEVCLYSCEIELSDRLKITSIDELKEWFDEFPVEPIEDEWFSKELPENCIVIELSSHRGSFNRTYYKPWNLYVKGEYLGSYSIGYRRIENYSDLWGHEVFDNLFDYVEKYGSDEDAISLLKNKFNRDDAVNMYGLSELQAEWIYEEEIEETEE